MRLLTLTLLLTGCATNNADCLQYREVVDVFECSRRGYTMLCQRIHKECVVRAE